MPCYRHLCRLAIAGFPALFPSHAVPLHSPLPSPPSLPYPCAGGDRRHRARGGEQG